MLEDAICLMAASPDNSLAPHTLTHREPIVRGTANALDCDMRISRVCTCQDNVTDHLEDAAQEAGRADDGDELLYLHRFAAIGHKLVRSGPRPWGWGVGKGNALGTRRALAQSHKLVLKCAAPGCAALVDLQAARRRARERGRRTFAAGDGCGSRTCSRNFRPGQFERRQRTMAVALQEGSRELIRWPAVLASRAVWRASAAEAHAAGTRAVTADAFGRQRRRSETPTSRLSV